MHAQQKWKQWWMISLLLLLFARSSFIYFNTNFTGYVCHQFGFYHKIWLSLSTFAFCLMHSLFWIFHIVYIVCVCIFDKVEIVCAISVWLNNSSFFFISFDKTVVIYFDQIFISSVIVKFSFFPTIRLFSIFVFPRSHLLELEWLAHQKLFI